MNKWRLFLWPVSVVTQTLSKSCFKTVRVYPKLTHLRFNQWDNERGLQFTNVYPLIKDIMRKRGHKWILDYTDMFSRDEYIYIDFCHVSPNGNLIIAKQIYKDIKRLYGKSLETANGESK